MCEGWTQVRLDDAAQVNPAEKVDKKATVNFVAMPDVAEHYGGVTGHSQRPASKGGMKFRAQDTLVARITPCLQNRKIAMAPVDLGDEVCMGSTEFIVVRAKKGVTEPAFVELLLQTDGFADYGIPLMVGSTGRQRLDAKYVKDYKVQIPPFDEQRRIVDLVGAVDDAIEAAEDEASSAGYAMKAILEEVGQRPTSQEPFNSHFDLAYGKALKSGERDGGPFGVYGAAGPVGSHSQSTSGVGPVIVVGRKGVNSLPASPVPLRISTEESKAWGGAGSVRYSEESVWVIDTAYEAKLVQQCDPRAGYWSLVLADLPAICTRTTLPGLSKASVDTLRIVPPSSFSDGDLELLDGFEETCRSSGELARSLRKVRSELLTALLSGAHEIPSTYDEVMSAAAQAATSDWGTYSGRNRIAG